MLLFPVGVGGVGGGGEKQFIKNQDRRSLPGHFVGTNHTRCRYSKEEETRVYQVNEEIMGIGCRP